MVKWLALFTLVPTLSDNYPGMHRVDQQIK